MDVTDRTAPIGGRPTTRINVCVSRAGHASIFEAAERAGISAAQFMREAALARATRQEIEAETPTITELEGTITELLSRVGAIETTLRTARRSAEERRRVLANAGHGGARGLAQ